MSLSPLAPIRMHIPKHTAMTRQPRHAARAAQGLLEKGCLWPLAPAAIAVDVAARCKQWAFRLGLRQRHRAPVPVIAVGNCIAGGSGKTPLVAWIRDRCVAHGAQPAVVARGYKGDGEANDEARMLGSATYCHPQRIVAARRAAADGATVIILDDAFQHQQCHRDLNLVCVDATRPWGWPGSRRGALLPWGLMREPAAAIRRADAVIATRCDQAPRALLEHLQACCRHWRLPLLRSQHAPHAVHSLTDPSHTQAPSELWGRRVVACSAIARPQAFHRTLQGLGARIVGHRAFPDHYHFQTPDMHDLAHAARSLQASIVCTAKDAVKLTPLLQAHTTANLVEQPWLALDIALSFNADDNHTLSGMIHQVLEEHSP
ncbi:MAG: tetraacyldisaccharide 4'-kinase [Planctomycetota bacterium]|nr:MAG: tetraacyldisaccharide 4'-kinase [Planctomycetota bacterium]